MMTKIIKIDAPDPQMIVDGSTNKIAHNRTAQTAQAGQPTPTTSAINAATVEATPPAQQETTPLSASQTGTDSATAFLNRRPGWWKESIVYQIYPRSFQDTNGDGIGDLRGIIERLDYIHALGADVIWICPVYDSPNDDNGYDIRDYYRIHEEFGTMDDMRELIDRAAGYGIRIIMDLVANHTSDEHAWFVESRSSLVNDKRDWYIWRQGEQGQPPNNWTSFFGGSAWQFDETTGEYYLHCFSRKQPDLNWENPDVRHALYDMMNWWLELGIAGFRVDAITVIKKDQHLLSSAYDADQGTIPVASVCLNRPGITDFLQEMKQEALLPHHALTVAEAPGVPVTDMEHYVDEEHGAFNMIFQFDHVDLDWSMYERATYKPWKLSQFKQALSNWQTATAERSWMALYMENHDHVRSVSKFANDATYRERSAKMLAAYYFLMRGTPFIYQGQELGMTNHYFDSIEHYRDLDSINMYNEQLARGRSEQELLDYLHKRSRDQGRMPMQWDDSASAGFTTGQPWLQVNPNYTEINVAAQLQDEQSVLHFYRRLASLRKAHPALIYGDYAALYTDSEQIGAYTRTYKQEFWTVWCNFTNSTILLSDISGGEWMLGNMDDHESGTLRPFETVIYRTIQAN
ncbi:alpha-glucosidase [Paenibacillus campi]|uniref:glycoside hydrolase family 13 protein n=1 Tax=Paenibacillus campi TaxID=3106031 RepID=UPI002AFEF406|nr:alpha-glucosidase [Paenibacillus sp. SGZ-1009]